MSKRSGLINSLFLILAIFAPASLTFSDTSLFLDNSVIDKALPMPFQASKPVYGLKTAPIPGPKESIKTLINSARAEWDHHHVQQSLDDLDNIIKNYPNGGEAIDAYSQKIRELVELKRDKEASQELEIFIDSLPENPKKHAAEIALAKVYSKSGNEIISTELHVRAYGFLVLFLSGISVCIVVAGVYMGLFAIMKFFFRKKLLEDPAPAVFRPKHIFYFLLWMLLIPFTFNVILAWVLIRFHGSINNLDLNQFCFLFFDLVLMFLSLVYLRKKYNLSNEMIGFVSRGFKINVLLPWAVLTAEFIITLIVLLIFHRWKIPIKQTPLHHMVEMTLQAPARANLMIAFVTLVVIGPVTEEIVFRGFFYNAFKKHTNVTCATFLSALLFASGHDPQPFVYLILFISGVIWAIIYEKTKSLIPCMVCHMLHNSLAFIAVFLSTPH